MTHIFIGCDKFQGPRELYFRKLSALEVGETQDGKVSDTRLDDWRTRSPKGFAFVMQALRGVGAQVEDTAALPKGLQSYDARSFGLLKDTDAVRAAWAETLRMAERLGPKIITVETPLAFSPSDENRRQIAWFAKELAPQWRGAVAWKPHGLWELEESIVLARELGLIPIYDPFENLDDVPPPRGGTAYFRLYERRGTRSRFDAFDMEELLERCAPFQRAIVIFKGTRRYQDARLAYTTWESQRDMELG